MNPTSSENIQTLLEPHGFIKTRIFRPFKIWSLNVFYTSLKIIGNFFSEMNALELLFIKVNFLFAIISQILYFAMLDVMIMKRPSASLRDHTGVVSGVSILAIYSTIGFFVAQVKQILENYWHRTSGVVNLTTQRAVRFLKLAIELFRAVALGSRCLKDHETVYQLNILYSLLSFSYYISTEAVFMDVLTTGARYFSIPELDALEHLYVPLILKTYALISGTTLIIAYLIIGIHKGFALVGLYFLIYLRLKEVYFNCYKILTLQRETYASCNTATESEIMKWNDVCAICLGNMETAKITPCNHLFHPSCLKHCLKNSLLCPLCKQDFIK